MARQEDKRKNIILDLLKSLNSKPLTMREISQTLEVPRADKNLFKQYLNELTDSGDLIKVKGGCYAIPTKLNLIKGIISCHPDGFGFLIPLDKEKDGEEDLFIPPRRLKGAMNGDTCMARVEHSKPGGKREGSIVRITDRANKQIIGTLTKRRGASYVIPSNSKILETIDVSVSDSKKAPEGTVVSVEITKWGTGRIPPFGKITDVIGSPDDPDVEAEVILRSYNLPSDFPEEVLNNLTSVPDKVSENETTERVDLRDLQTFTIDGETAKDFDDAVAVKKTPTGFTLWVSIADVSYYVEEGTEIDIEAFKRGTSVYFPDRCIPMLPEKLSNGICSLNPNVDRLTMTAEIDFDNDGNVTEKKFYESIIQSKERLTYTIVKNIINITDPKLTEKYSHITDDIFIMRDLAVKLNKLRGQDGSIDFDLPEPQIIIDIEGTVEDIVRSERNIAHRIIEEFMLSANRAVAEEFSSKKYPFIYRTHDTPSADSIVDFKDFIKSFGYALNEKAGPKAYNQLLSEIAGKPEEHLITQVLLRSMKQAQYTESNHGHFGLAFKDYTHFTSPIRRYPDLIVHRLLKKLINNKYTKGERLKADEYLPEAAAQLSRQERVAMEAERDIVDLKKAQFMEDKVGNSYEGIISGVTGFGVFVELKKYFVEGLVHVTSLDDDYYTFYDKEHKIVGERTGNSYSLGDNIEVIIFDVDVKRRRIDLKLAGTNTNSNLEKKTIKKKPKKNNSTKKKKKKQKK